MTCDAAQLLPSPPSLQWPSLGWRPWVRAIGSLADVVIPGDAACSTAPSASPWSTGERRRAASHGVWPNRENDDFNYCEKTRIPVWPNSIPWLTHPRLDHFLAPAL